MDFKLIAQLLREFDYIKNGKEESIYFLISMLHNLTLVDDGMEVIDKWQS